MSYKYNKYSHILEDIYNNKLLIQTATSLWRYPVLHGQALDVKVLKSVAESQDVQVVADVAQLKQV